MSIFQDSTHPYLQACFKSFSDLSPLFALDIQKRMQSALDVKVDQQLIGWSQVIDKAPPFEKIKMELRSEFRLEGTWKTPLTSPLDNELPDYFHPISSPTTVLEATQQHFFHLHPWRKGPFFLGDLHIDTEWRSDWKWDRVRPHLSNLKGRRVLDVGGGNGYHAWRMYGDDADSVLCVDPTRVFHAQFRLLSLYVSQALHCIPPVFHLPFTLDVFNDLCSSHQQRGLFDTVFSMGVLYHRKDPHQHLKNLAFHLRSGGELVLETLVVDGDQPLELSGRYAQMRNVWNLVDLQTLKTWLEQVGFVQIRLVNLNQTSFDEQRRTEWMRFYSLSEALDPQNPDLTIEGHPAPLRATYIAQWP